jgi:hypothetical protein
MIPQTKPYKGEKVLYGAQPTTPTPDELQKILLDRLNLSETEQKDFLFPQYKIIFI